MQASEAQHLDRRQQRRRRGVRMLVTALLALALAGATAALWLIWIPNRRLADVAFLERASPAETKSIAERALRTRWGNHHDACLILEKVGDAASVPILIRALASEPPARDDIMECGTVHCLAALRNLTGYDAGSDAQAWQAWWNATGSKR
jgi:hypothetical protein